MAEVYVLGGGMGHVSAPLQIRSGGKDVLTCGTVFSADSKSIEFRVGNLKVVLNFMAEAGGAPRVDTTRVDASTLSFNLFNFNNALGTGTTTPILMGNLFQRQLWMAFSVSSPATESIKVVHYTFFLGDPA